MHNNIYQKLKTIIKGDIIENEKALKSYSHDASLFEVMPQIVVAPKDDEDVKNLVKFLNDNKKSYPDLSITARSGGTDMSGGSINNSIIIDFSKYFNATPQVKGDYASTQPGVYYRDFEKETLKSSMIFPSYPASREICAMGGILNNNSGGEKSLKYGKTEKYVKRMKVVLSDGSICELKKLSDTELKKKISLKTFEGEIYRKMYKLILDNYDEIVHAKPAVSKNSAGYFLWNIYDKKEKTFDLTALWVGAQGTLGMLLDADIKLVPIHKHRIMQIIFLQNLSHLGEIIDEVLPLEPESFESYDDNTLKLSLRYFPEFAKQLGLGGLIQSAIAFMPAFLQMAIGRLPKLILQVDFTGNNLDELYQKISTLNEKLKHLHLQTTTAVDDEEKKYWLIRRESFNLLRKKIRDKHTAPFIDDFVIDPHKTEEVINQVTLILKKHPEFVFTVAGHIGDGNFHIIPLVDITNKKVRDAIPAISQQVYEIVAKNNGSITGEHNDGLIRTPYLEQMYGKTIIKLFEETKKIFDPQNIFNPRKKVHGDLNFAMTHLRQQW
jgi:FAD/FMN-containing dehydrogenase